MNTLEPPAATRPSRRFRRTKPMVVAGVVIASLLAGSIAVGARSDDTAGYRTATAGTHTVDQVLSTVGTIEPVSQASVAFPVDGTVDQVSVEVGDTVTVGQELASLDIDDLTATLHQKEATLEQAELTLSLALAGDDVSTASGTGTPSGGGLGRSATSGSSGALASAQQAVLDGQKAVDEALVAAQSALDSASSVCAATDTSTGTTTTTTTATTAATTTEAGSDDAAATGSSDSTGSGSTASTAADVTACETALQASLNAQQDVTTAQKALAEASDELTSLLEDLAADTTSGETTTDNGTGTSQPADTGSTPSGTSSASSGSQPSGADATTGSAATGGSSSPSAEDLIAYQKAVDAAALDVTVAEQAVAQATIVSPIAGTVVSVDLKVGDEATAASSTQSIVIVGESGVEVTTSVSVTDLPDIEVGQSATVTPDGTSEELEGEVVRIGAAADTSSSTASYSVTISLTGDTSDLGNGSTASVEIITDDAGKALAVPTSAVTVTGDRATVQTIEDGKAVATKVEIGAVGQSYTEITDGLESGDEVVLADLDEALPGSATSTDSSSSSGTSGGFPGGGMGAMPTGAPGN